MAGDSDRRPEGRSGRRRRLQDRLRGMGLRRSTARLRKIALALAAGETTSAAAKMFGVTPGEDFSDSAMAKKSWEAFQCDSRDRSTTAASGRMRRDMVLPATVSAVAAASRSDNDSGGSAECGRGLDPVARSDLDSFSISAAWSARQSWLPERQARHSKNICSRPAGATAITSGLFRRFLNQCGCRPAYWRTFPRSPRPFSANQDGDLAFEYVEAFFLPAVDVRRRTAARRHDGFPQGILAVRVLAGRQKPVYVADDSDGRPSVVFAGLVGASLDCLLGFLALDRLNVIRVWRWLSLPGSHALSSPSLT